MPRDRLVACHCDMCRRWTGGVFTSFQAEEGYVVTGPVRIFESSDVAERAFCSECGSSLWYRMHARPGEAREAPSFAAGLFENAAGARLQVEFFSDLCPDGYAFAGDHKRMTEADCMAAFAPAEDPA
tara:strand:+ start:2082 stop:2462 length:381 start_codon:yes stop_codon:yes gene_type:complete